MGTCPLATAHWTAEQSFCPEQVQVLLPADGLRQRDHRCALFSPRGSRGEAETGGEESIERHSAAARVTARGTLCAEISA